jgi:hypothetical protein
VILVRGSYLGQRLLVYTHFQSGYKQTSAALSEVIRLTSLIALARCAVSAFSATRKQGLGDDAAEFYEPYSISRMTISGFDPSRSGGLHLSVPREVKTCIFP